jgi:hypothetical protein
MCKREITAMKDEDITEPRDGAPDSAPVSGYETIKALAKARGVRIPDLLVRAHQNDPFYAGSPAQIEKAAWFLHRWRAMGYAGQSGIHLRRIHYRMVSQAEPVLMPDGNAIHEHTGLLGLSRQGVEAGALSRPGGTG